MVNMMYTNKQNKVLDEIIEWRKSSNQIYEFGGLPGTGKSTILLEALRRINLPIHKVACMSYIGQAAIIMRCKGLYNAKTIHSWLFNPVQKPKIKNGKVEMDTYFNKPKMELDFEPKPLQGIEMIIIDEGYAVPYWLKEHIESRGLQILVTGDPNQLPPVGDSPAYLTDTSNIIILDEIIRQNRHSALLYLADRVINNLPIHKGFYGDVYVIDRDELTDSMILNSDVVICGTNNTRNYINNRVRNNLLNLRSNLPIINEKMVCRKNNWNIEIDGINLANGLCGVVTNMPSVHDFNGVTYKMNFKPNMLNSCFNQLDCDYKYLIASQEEKNKLRNNKYSKGEKFEFAYAITTHMSQGAQYDNGIYIEEFINKDFHNNLNYTGITRFSNSLIYVKPVKKYF